MVSSSRPLHFCPFFFNEKINFNCQAQRKMSIFYPIYGIIFLHSHHMRKNSFYAGVCFVCLSVVCKHDNFRKNYQIRFRFDTLFYSIKRKNGFVHQSFLTNGFLVFIHQKRFLQNQKIHFPVKIYKMR